MKLNSLDASRTIPPEPVVIIAAFVPKPVVPKVTGFTLIVDPNCKPIVAVAAAPIVGVAVPPTVLKLTKGAPVG